ncbi:MAG TPA: CHAD domain-containing protein [Streptosporangiaceae bacterium]|nr:CHAD domain-containing protein [Streptosporangiaceae bacterium]
MLNAVRDVVEFVLTRPDDARAQGDGFLEISDSRFRVAPTGQSRTIRRVWLDTFDWRLFRAGLSLEYTTARGARELVLTARDGDLIAEQNMDASRPRWPARIEQLPDGPLREHVSAVIGVRALLPVVRATSVQTKRRAFNADDKTIAILTTELTTLTQPAKAATPPRVTIGPLRGYQAQAGKLADALARLPGVARADQTAFEAALRFAGRRAGDYTSKIDVRLSADMPAAFAVCTVLTRLFGTAQANVPGTIRDIDTEFLHDLRIAVRRTRSVLKMAGSVLPAALPGRYSQEFKWLGDLTTPTRDLDVYLIGYPAMAGKLIAATEPELRPFHDYLAGQRATAQRQLARGLRSARFAGLARQWQHDLKQVASNPGRRPATGRFAAERIRRAHQRVLRSGGAIDASSPPQALHDLRKRCKELRYMLEVFASLHDPGEQWRAVNELKALQDCLGEFQDTEVQQTELRAFARKMVAEARAPAETVLAMGEIAAGLAVRQRAARGEFAGLFASFASARGQARIETLTRAAS